MVWGCVVTDTPERTGAPKAPLWPLAERLYYFLEKHDPTEGAKLWAHFSEWERDYYLTVITDVLGDRELVRGVLS